MINDIYIFGYKINESPFMFRSCVPRIRNFTFETTRKKKKSYYASKRRYVCIFISISILLLFISRMLSHKAIQSILQLRVCPEKLACNTDRLGPIMYLPRYSAYGSKTTPVAGFFPTTTVRRAASWQTSSRPPSPRACGERRGFGFFISLFFFFFFFYSFLSSRTYFFFYSLAHIVRRRITRAIFKRGVRFPYARVIESWETTTGWERVWLRTTRRRGNYHRPTANVRAKNSGDVLSSRRCFRQSHRAQSTGIGITIIISRGRRPNVILTERKYYRFFSGKKNDTFHTSECHDNRCTFTRRRIAQHRRTVADAKKDRRRIELDFRRRKNTVCYYCYTGWLV